MITKKTRALLCAMLGLMAVSPTTVNAQDDFGLVQQTLPNPENTPLPVFPVPSERQLKWNETEFYAFFHYGMNTYTGEEWGLGSESENQFAPPLCPTPCSGSQPPSRPACKAASPSSSTTMASACGPHRPRSTTSPRRRTPTPRRPMCHATSPQPPRSSA